MTTLTLRLPDDKHARLKALAAYKNISLNKLLEEISTRALAEFDTEVRFRTLAASGDTQKGLDILDKLDKHFEKWFLAKPNLNFLYF